MSFPASEMFADDDRVTPTLLKVYRWCYRHLDRFEVRAHKLAYIEKCTGIKERHLSPALTQLVEWGYLIEHKRLPHQSRRLSLAQSVRSSEATVLEEVTPAA